MVRMVTLQLNGNLHKSKPNNIEPIRLIHLYKFSRISNSLYYTYTVYSIRQYTCIMYATLKNIKFHLNCLLLFLFNIIFWFDHFILWAERIIVDACAMYTKYNSIRHNFVLLFFSVFFRLFNFHVFVCLKKK